jgi:signal transduction histidine kinase
MKKRIPIFLRKYVLPKSKNDDFARREFILNILLVASIALIIFGAFLYAIVAIFNFFDPATHSNNTLSWGVEIAMLAFFFLLYILSRKGFFSLAAYFLLGSFFLLAAYMSYRWGIELPASLLFYVLIIVMSGILINSRFAFLAAIFISLTAATINYFRIINIVQPNLYWKKEVWGITDIAMASIIFLVIATVSWLSNREVKKALVRAKKSEADLKIERDSLEIKVEERTKELKEAQLEKVTQLNRFAEFGRLSSGLFHDLINPLNAVALNMEGAKKHEEKNPYLAEVNSCLDRAIAAAAKMGDFVAALHRQIMKEEERKNFSLTEEIRQVIEILSYKALKAKVKIFFSSTGNVWTVGDAVKFSQISLNLIVNAIEAYPPAVNDAVKAGGIKREVNISLQAKNNKIIFTVKDYGAGISATNARRIFKPFFTTKDGAGMGIGLSMVKLAVEKEFGGTIKFVSEIGKGTTFIINFTKRDA